MKNASIERHSKSCCTHRGSTTASAPIDDDELKVVAIAHLKRRPHYWLTRVNE